MSAARLLGDAVAATTLAAVLASFAALAVRRAQSGLRHSVWRVALAAFWVVPAAAVTADVLHVRLCPIARRAPSAVPRAAWRPPVRPVFGTAGPRSVSPRPLLSVEAPVPRPAPFTRDHLGDIGVWLWGGGVFLSGAYLLRHLRAVRRLRNSGSPVGDRDLRSRVAWWCARMGVRRAPTLVGSPGVAVPTIVGSVRPTLLLPSSFSLEDPSCDAVLVHELAHIARGDVLAHCLARGARVVWWWHPLSWVAAAALGSSSEEACDDWAVALTGQREAYADHLVRWAEAAGAGTLAYTCAGRKLVGRVRRILGGTRPPQLRPSRRARRTLTACALCTILAAAVLRAAPEEPGKTRTRPEAEAMDGPDSGKSTEVLPQQLVELTQRKFAESLGDGIVYQAGLPTAYVQALNQAGTEVDFAGFTAMSGWAFSFGYKYGDISPGFLAVRGEPGTEGPYQAFQIAEWFGYGYESAPTEERDKLWAFVRQHVDAGRPILSEHLDGGLICGYREKGGKREVWFSVNPGADEPEWVDVNDLQPYEVCALVRKGDALPERELYLKALQRAVRYAQPHESGGVPQGLAALEAYAVDVADPSKDFANCGEYFCWATFERLEARKCSAVWLERAAQVLEQPKLRQAAQHYQRAYEAYEEYRKAVGAGDPKAKLTQEQLRSPERISQVVPLLRRAIGEERTGLGEMVAALGDLGLEVPVAGTATAFSRAGFAGSPADWPARKVLEGVPALGFEKGELTLAGCITSCMQFLTEDISYELVMGVSGGAFKLFWHPDWCPSSGDLSVLGEDPVRRALRALGYGYQLLPKSEEAGFQQAVVASINAGRPVIAFGVVGPPEACVITGYDERGDVLLGWSYFADASKGYYRKANWRDDCYGLVRIGEKAQAPSKQAVLRDALEWAVELARVPERNGYHSGLAAYDEWARALGRDQDFAAKDLEALNFKCLVHTNVVLSVLLEARRSAAAFLTSMKGAAGPARGELLEATAAYEGEVRVLEQAMKLSPHDYSSEKERRKLLDPEVRAKLAGLVLSAKEKDKKAVGHLEQALGRMASS